MMDQLGQWRCWSCLAEEVTSYEEISAKPKLLVCEKKTSFSVCIRVWVCACVCVCMYVCVHMAQVGDILTARLENAPFNVCTDKGTNDAIPHV